MVIIQNSCYLNFLYLFVFGMLLCSIGLSGFLLAHGNTILFLISNEIFLLGVIFGFVSIGEFYSDMTGQLFSIVILVVAAVETAVILVIFLVYNRYNNAWELDLINTIQQPVRF